MQRAWLDFARETPSVDDAHWPVYRTPQRLTRLITSARDVMAPDPDGPRRAAWASVY